MTIPSVEFAREFSAWAEAFDAERETVETVTARLDAFDHGGAAGGLPERTLRLFKPNPRWQAVRRRAARWSIDAYTTELMLNRDGTAGTGCSFAYDIADVDELLRNAPEDAERAAYFDWVGWDYALHRIAACSAALRVHDGHAGERRNPFRRIAAYDRSVRFVTWSTDSSSHASEDSEDILGASTLCGGKLAFHKHTHQQWTRYACGDCLRVLRGEPERPRFITVSDGKI